MLTEKMLQSWCFNLESADSIEVRNAPWSTFALSLGSRSALWCGWKKSLPPQLSLPSGPRCLGYLDGAAISTWRSGLAAEHCVWLGQSGHQS